MTNTFTVRACTDVTEATKYFKGWAINEHWDPGHGDIKHAFYPYYPEGFFVGCTKEQDKEQVVSCIYAMKPDGIGHIALYIVGDPDQRGKGYGFRVFQHALNYLSSCKWVRLTAVSAQVETYKRSGFIMQAPIARFEGGRSISDIDAATAGLASVPIEQLIGIDKRYTGMYRPTFITQWIRYHTTEKHCYGLAVVEQDQVVGFACMRRCVSGAYSIAPVYADTSDNAHALVAKLTSLVEEGAQFLTDVCITNSRAEDMFTNKIGWKPVMTMYTMWKKNTDDSTEAPKGDSNGCFAIAAPEVG